MVELDLTQIESQLQACNREDKAGNSNMSCGARELFPEFQFPYIQLLLEAVA